MTQMYFEYLASPIGPFLVAGTDTTLCVTGFPTGHQQRQPEPDWHRDGAPLRYATEQLAAYFDGERVDFDVPLNPMGTPFQHDVWRALQKIPYGETTTYGELARSLGKPNASRAVGAANGANHIPVIIPCHRVIGSNGSLTGFAGGLTAKRTLLELEAAGRHAAQLALFQ